MTRGKGKVLVDTKNKPKTDQNPQRFNNIYKAVLKNVGK